MISIHRIVLRRLLAAWLIVSVLIGGVAYYIETEKIDDAIVARKADRPGVDPLGDVPLDAVEGTAANEQNVLGVERDHFLVGVLATALRGYVHYRTFQQFEQRLLHAFAAHVAGNGWAITFA